MIIEKAELAWFGEHLTKDILPHWLSHALTPNGLFFPHLGRDWSRLDKDTCSLVSQTRLLYNFSTGFAITGRKEYVDAVNHGADALLRYFADPEHGGWYLRCKLDGTPIDTRKDLYGHAFAIFGLTHASVATERADLKQAALDTWELVRSQFQDAEGGYQAVMSRTFSPLPHTRSQNPIMHLFEAIFALSRLDDSGKIRREGHNIANLESDPNALDTP